MEHKDIAKEFTEDQLRPGSLGGREKWEGRSFPEALQGLTPF